MIIYHNCVIINMLNLLWIGQLKTHTSPGPHTSIAVPLTTHASVATTPHSLIVRPISKGERNILQVNIDGLGNKLEELELLIHDTLADIITIQETKLAPKATPPKLR